MGSAKPPLWVGLLVAAVLCDPDAPCYYPTGQRAWDFYPCDPTAYMTMCCPGGYTCFSNSLCVVTTPTEAYPGLTEGTALRGACTNPLWNNAICGDHCLNATTTEGGLVACGPDTSSSGERFCCAGDYEDGSCNCSGQGHAFAVAAGTAQTIVGVSGASFTGTASYLVTAPDAAATGGASSSSSTRAPASSTTTPGSPTAAAGTSSSKRPESSSSTASSALPIASSSSPTSSSRSSSAADPTSSRSPPASDAGDTTTTSDAQDPQRSTVAVKAGLGVGIPLLVAAVAGLTAWVYRRRRRRHQQRAYLTSSPPSQPPHNDRPKPPQMVAASAAEIVQGRQYRQGWGASPSDWYRGPRGAEDYSVPHPRQAAAAITRQDQGGMSWPGMSAAGNGNGRVIAPMRTLGNPYYVRAEDWSAR